MDPVYIVNFVLCIVIVALSLVIYNRTKATLPICTGIAFGLFGLSHLAVLLGLARILEPALIVIRSLGYLVVIYALFRLWQSDLAKKS